MLIFPQHWHIGLLDEMLGSIREDADDNDWRVLLVDKESMKILSASCRLFDVMEKGISGTLIFFFLLFCQMGGGGDESFALGLVSRQGRVQLWRMWQSVQNVHMQ